MKSAKTAWELSEQISGDTKLTGDLAHNYAALTPDKIQKSQLEAIERSMKLVHGYDSDRQIVYMERGLRRLFLLKSLGKDSAALKGAKNLAKFAEENGLESSTFYGEALTVMAGEYSAKGRNKMAADTAEKAMAVFERATDGVVTAYPLQATLYRGYAYEGEENHMAAALEYQKVMEATDGLDPAEFDLVGTTLGRWIYMRSALSSNGKLDEAEAEGLCKCWPYDKDRNEAVQPVNRVPPKMPQIAQQSGYVVVEFDLTDDGIPTNERVVTAWPDYYEEPALESLSRWEYTPRTPDQTDEDRTDIVTTISFRLTTQGGELIW